MLIARAITPAGLSYGVVEGDAFKMMRRDPYDGVELATGSFALSDVKLTAPVSPVTFLIMMGGFIRPEKGSADPHFNGDFVQPDGWSRPDIDPYLFPKAVVAPCGMDDEVVRPPNLPGPLLLEPEIAVVIGRKVRGISVDDAMSAVLGFTNFNDVTVGEFLPGRPAVQHLAFGDLFQAKCADTAASVGPYIRTDLTEKDIDAGLAIEGRLNGEVRVTGNTRNLKFGISQTISYASRYRTLYPGDVIAFGTPATPPEIEIGDVMEVEVEGLGTLRNTLR